MRHPITFRHSVSPRRPTALLAALLLLALLTGCGDGGVELSDDWQSAQTHTVVRKDGRRLLVGLDLRGARALPLAWLPGTAAAELAQDSAVIADGKRTLVLAGDGSGFGASVLALDPAARKTNQLGTVAEGRFPLAGPDGGFYGVGAKADGATSVLAAYGPDGRRTSGRDLPVTVVAGGEGCLVGTPDPAQPGRVAVLRPGGGGAEGRTFADRATPVDVSCRGGDTLVSLSAEGAGADSHIVLYSRGAGVPVRIDVGSVPGRVRLLDGGLAAVDVARGAGRAVRIVELPSGRVRSETVLDHTSQVTALESVAGQVVALGSREANLIDPGTGAKRVVTLPGENLAYRAG